MIMENENDALGRLVTAVGCVGMLLLVARTALARYALWMCIITMPVNQVHKMASTIPPSELNTN